jgi:hypothetical protein
MKFNEVTAKLDRMYMMVYGSPEGQEVLEDLIRRFAPERLDTGDPHTTAVRVGESNPIRYIQRRIKDGLERKSG